MEKRNFKYNIYNKKDNPLISGTDFPELIVKYSELLLAGY